MVAHEVRGVTRKLATSLAKRLGEIERRLTQATVEAASTGREMAEKSLEELRASFGEIRAALEVLGTTPQEISTQGRADALTEQVEEHLQAIEGRLERHLEQHLSRVEERMASSTRAAVAALDNRVAAVGREIAVLREVLVSELRAIQGVHDRGASSPL